MKTVTVIPGDGIGPEIIKSAIDVVNATGAKINWKEAIAGETALKKYKTVIPEDTIKSIKKNKVVLKAPITTPVGKGFRSVNVQLRKMFELYANVRPAKYYKGIPACFDKLDLVVIRENLEDLYAGVEFKKGNFKNLPKDTAVSLKLISEKNTKNISEFAYKYATAHKRKKITIVHKANILKETDGLFLKVAEKIGKKYPKIKTENRIVDNMAMQLVREAEDYDMLLCPNLYGDIISDLCAGLVGGLGLAPSANIGKNMAMFEAVHGSAPDLAGKNKANPTALILSAGMMLQYLGMKKEANKLETAVKKTLAERKKVTYDLAKGKGVSTTEMTKEIIKQIQ